MVKGLDTFRRHFDGHTDQFILIGGTAATLAMEGAGLEFRATKRELDGLSWIGEDRLIPLKAHAWLDLGERKVRGEPVDSKSIRKHANDVMRLSQLLSPASRTLAPPKIAEDLGRFLKAVIADETYSPQSLGLDTTFSQIAERISLAYQLKHA